MILGPELESYLISFCSVSRIATVMLEFGYALILLRNAFFPLVLFLERIPILK